MERDSGTNQPTSDGASELLNELAADRSALAERLAPPWWLYPAFGVLVAIYVASPLIDPESLRRIVSGVAIASTILLAAGFQRIAGVKVSRAGTPARLTLVLLLLVVLLLLSASFDLASFGLHGWIVATAVTGFGLTVVLGKLFDAQYREKVRHGR